MHMGVGRYMYVWCMCVHVCVCMCVCMYVCACVCVHVCVHVYVCVKTIVALLLQTINNRAHIISLFLMILMATSWFAFNVSLALTTLLNTPCPV